MDSLPRDIADIIGQLEKLRDKYHFVFAIESANPVSVERGGVVQVSGPPRALLVMQAYLASKIVGEVIDDEDSSDLEDESESKELYPGSLN